MELTSDGIHRWLEQSDQKTLDALNYGVIGIDSADIIRRYNLQESKYTLLDPADVIGRPLFTDIALCMDTGLIAGRFSQAREKAQVLDTIIDYFLAFKSGAGPVQMRLLHSPEASLDYLLIRRIAS